MGPAGCVLCATATGDGDGDCHVDLADYAALQWCFTGMGSPYAPNCAGFDADWDGDIDPVDLALLTGAWAGPGAAVAGCTPCR